MMSDKQQLAEAQQRIAALTVNLTKIFKPMVVVGRLAGAA